MNNETTKQDVTGTEAKNTLADATALMSLMRRARKPRRARTMRGIGSKAGR